MQYTMRWLPVLATSAAISVAGFFYLVKPVISEMNSLHIIEKRLQQDVANLRAHVAKNSSARNNTAVQGRRKQLPGWKELLSVFHFTDMQILSVTASRKLPYFSDAIETKRIHAKGDYMQLVNLFHALSSSQHAFLITDFSLKPDLRAAFSADLEIMMLNGDGRYTANHLLSSRVTLSDPFCHGDNKQIMRDAGASAMLSTPYELMKMIGYLQNANRINALILLPNQQLKLVQAGAVLGSEKAIISRILPDRLQLLFPDKSRREMLLSDQA